MSFRTRLAVLGMAMVLLPGAAATSSAAVIGFEGVAPPGGVDIPAVPYAEAGFTFTSNLAGAINGIFDSANPVAHTNGTDVFGWCAESCLGLQVITVVGPGSFSISSIDISYLFAGEPIPPGLAVNLVGHFSGGGSIATSLLVTPLWVTHALVGFTGLSSLEISGLGSTSDQDPAIDNLVVTAVPEPATLVLLGAGLGFAAARRRIARRHL